MSELASQPPIRDVIARYRLGARRGLGQHFLMDMNLTDRIARAAAPLADTTVIEVGPGPGALTRSLLAHGARRVVAIERDERCVAALQDLIAACPGRLLVIEGDALKIGAARLCAEHGGGRPCKIVANLPYNIATALLLNWLAELASISEMTLMLQKEVALRIVAGPGSKTYGRLSVIIQWLCQARRLFDLPPRAFVPPPKVTSSLVQLTPRPQPLAAARREDLERVTAAAFGQRRKMLRTSLKSLDLDAGALIAAAGVDGTARAEALSVEDFCALARAAVQLSG